MDIYKDWANTILNIRKDELEEIVSSDADISVAEYKAIGTSLEEQYKKFIANIDPQIPYACAIKFLFNSASIIAEFKDVKNTYITKPSFNLKHETEIKAYAIYTFNLVIFYCNHAEYNKAIECLKQMLNLNIDKLFSIINDYEIDLQLGLAYGENGDSQNSIAKLEPIFTWFNRNEKAVLVNRKMAYDYLASVNWLSINYGLNKDYLKAIYFDRIAIDILKKQPILGNVDYGYLLINYNKALYKGLAIYKEKNQDGTITEYDIASEIIQVKLDFEKSLENLLPKEQVILENYIFIHDVILGRNIEIAKKLIKQNIKTKASQQIEQLDYLYQYKSIINSKKAITNQIIYLNTPTNFNDYTDPFYRLFDDEYTKMTYNDVINGLGIACLTTKNDNLLMWSHYADSHKGVCIKYKVPSEINKDRIVLTKVNYSNKPIVMRGEVLTETKIDVNYRYVSFVDQLSTKSREWKYEDEYRIIGWNDTKKERSVKSKIEAVYMGKEISYKDEQKFKILANKYHFDLYKMKTNPSKLRSLKEELIYPKL